MPLSKKLYCSRCDIKWDKYDLVTKTSIYCPFCDGELTRKAVTFLMPGKLVKNIDAGGNIIPDYE